MKLSHRFTEKDKATIWINNPYCVICNSNQGCSTHHNYGSKGTYNNSIFNSVMLCHDCHVRADRENIHAVGNEFRRNLLYYSMRQVMKMVSKGVYEIKERDIKFLESVREDVEFIKNNMI